MYSTRVCTCSVLPCCTDDHLSWADVQEADADRRDRGDRSDRDDRSDRAQASLREREREVQMSRTRQEKEWDKEKDSLRKAEALQLFNTMLVDMVWGWWAGRVCVCLMWHHQVT